jgi:hypothetical protein
MRYGDDTLGCVCGGINARYPCPSCNEKLMVPRRSSYMRYCHGCGEDRVCETLRGRDLCVQACAPYYRQQLQEWDQQKLVEAVVARLKADGSLVNKCGLTATECQRRGGCAGHECDDTSDPTT